MTELEKFSEEELTEEEKKKILSDPAQVAIIGARLSHALFLVGATPVKLIEELLNVLESQELEPPTREADEVGREVLGENYLQEAKRGKSSVAIMLRRLITAKKEYLDSKANEWYLEDKERQENIIGACPIPKTPYSMRN